MSRSYILTKMVRLRLETKYGEDYKCCKCKKKFKDGDRVIPLSMRSRKWICEDCYNKRYEK